MPRLPRRARAVLLAAVAASTLAGVGPAATASATTPPTMAVVGDSYAAGWTGNSRSQSDAWWQYTARDLGWQPGNIVANPGAGFLKPGDYGTLAQSLRDHPIPSWTDFVLVQGGLNDAGQDPDLIPGAVADLLGVIRQQAPGAVPIVVGAFAPIPDRSYGTHHVAVARAIGDWRAIGDTRYMIGFMCTFETGGDQVHPTALGHRQIGDWVAWHLAHNLGGNGEPLRWTGSFYTT